MSRVTIKNKDDLCCARAIVTMKALKDANGNTRDPARLSISQTWMSRPKAIGQGTSPARGSPRRRYPRTRKISHLLARVGGAVASWLVRSSPDRAVWVRALAGGHCVVFLGKTLNSHSASLHPGVQMGTGEFNAGGNPAMDWHPIQGGVEILLVASCHGNRS